MRPTLRTDAYEDEVTRRVPIIFLAGPIKHWWTCFGSPEHERYVAHRNDVRSTLIEAGYLTYAAWDAIKGSWDERAQAINDAAIRASDLMLVLTPFRVPAEGTLAETATAQRWGVDVFPAPPGLEGEALLGWVRRFVGEGVQYT